MATKSALEVLLGGFGGGLRGSWVVQFVFLGFPMAAKTGLEVLLGGFRGGLGGSWAVEFVFWPSRRSRKAPRGSQARVFGLISVVFVML